MEFSKIERAVEEISNGKFVIVVDSEERENEGDLVIAAERITPEKVNFMMKHARGLICVPMTGDRLDELKLPSMVNGNAGNRCAFAMSVDAKKGTTTGISAFDRAATIKALIDKKTNPEELLRPGHMFPIRYREGGVLKRQGHTEASVDLAKLAGLYPAAVICEIINDDGTMAKMNDLVRFAENHSLSLITVDEIVKFMELKYVHSIIRSKFNK